MGWSKPHSCLTVSMTCGFALRPASRSAGSPLGITLKIAKVTTEMANSTATIPTSRRMMNRPN
jgi:hypothetical protein